MQVMATGKWSKADKRWKMLVALRRLAGNPPAPASEPRQRRSNVRPLRKTES
jgi:hypothetical protein